MYRILLVDDEPNILSALRRCLASIDVGELDGDALKVEAFTSPSRRSSAARSRTSTSS